MSRSRSWWRAGLAAGVIVTAGGVGTAIASSASGVRGAAARQLAFRSYLQTHTGDDSDVLLQAEQYSYERTAPGYRVSGAALVSAYRQSRRLPVSGSAWTEVTTKPYNGQPAGYNDPAWSNAGAGFSIVGGRTTALVQGAGGTWFAGTADGGVWKSSDQGTTWTPTFDAMPTLSIGALAVNPADHSLWVGTGEANTNQDSYAGTGVYRTTNAGGTYTRVGDDQYGNNPLVSHTIYHLAFTSAGDAFAATDNGLWRYSHVTGSWTEVLAPGGPYDNPPYDNQVTSVAVVPGTNDMDVIAVVGWRGPTNTQDNGFYESTDGGSTFSPVTPTGDINGADIGRTTFAYSRTGSKLYAIVESPSALAAGKVSNLQGIYVSSGSPASVAGPWTLIADAAKLSASGSANAYGPDSVGAQSWYNQTLAVDPGNANHVYAGLEEVFETSNGGTTWNTASPYWNYGLACGSTCPNTTHPDQHALMVANGKIVEGNDGGVYSRPLSDTQQYGDWSDLNDTLRDLQYYDARAGTFTGGGVGYWGGLQDNGTSLMASGAAQNIEPAGGDGFDVIVKPTNANYAVGEYTDGAFYKTTDGGHTFPAGKPGWETISPGCAAQGLFGTPMPGCDPSFRFVTPIAPDAQTATTWVTGGRYVWETTAGWNTQCLHAATCSWKNLYDLGATNAATAVSSVNGGQTIWVAWVANGGNPGPGFASGIATNSGGTWHQVNTTDLPQRYIAGVTGDPANPAHAYAIFNGYSRRWIPGGGMGHVYETLDGGQTWTDISENLPDIPSDALVLKGGKLALATDDGVYTATAGQGLNTRWSRLGTGLPDVSVNDITVGPGNTIIAGTHGRGIWSLPF